MINYAAAAALAKRLIEANGRSISLLASSTVPDDVNKPWRGSSRPYTEPAPTTATAKGAFVGLSLADLGWQETNRPEDSLRIGNQYVLVAPSGVTPAGVEIEGYDAIKDGDKVWSIVKVHILKPGDTALLYAIEVVQ